MLRWLRFQLGVSLVRATGGTYKRLARRKYVAIIRTKAPTNNAPDGLKFVDVTGKVGGENDQMKLFIEKVIASVLMITGLQYPPRLQRAFGSVCGDLMRR